MTMIIDQIQRFCKEPGWLIEGTDDIEKAVALSERDEFNVTSLVVLCLMKICQLYESLKLIQTHLHAPVVGMLVYYDKASDAGFSHFI